MTDIEKREKNLFDMIKKLPTWKNAAEMITNDKDMCICKYDDTVVTLEKMNEFIYRLNVYDISPKYYIIDLEAEYHFNVNSGTMKMFYDSYQERIKDDSPAVILVDLFSSIDKELWWWINKPIAPKPISELFEKIKSGEFSDEGMEVDENEDKHN